MDTQQRKTLFDVESARSSVIDLAAKCKHLRGLQKELGAQIRAGEKNPSVPWGTDKFGEEITIDQAMVDEKRNERRSCSRAHQLAYAFIRGVPYRAVEEDARPNPYVPYGVVDALKDHLSDEGRVEVKGMYDPDHWWGSPLRKMLHGAVKAWLKEDPRHLAHIRATRDHQDLVDQGLGESETAEKLRDELQALWGALDDRQRAWVQGRLSRMQRQREARQERLRAYQAAKAERGAA